MQAGTVPLEGLKRRLESIYGDQADTAHALLSSVIGRYLELTPTGTEDEPQSALWDQRDVVLITYGDQVQPAEGESLSPLQSFQNFCREWQLPDFINTVHFLPFFPWSSDDGFSVMDYATIDPQLGDWNDVAAIGVQSHLMFDFVVNHVSQQHAWFESFLAGESPFDSFFITVEPGTDVSDVTRPRSLPLLHEFESTDGPKQVWTTFSRDQVDLNYAEPRLLAEAMGVLLDYVNRGARIIRLDAIAYLWKQIGTNCIHLPQTHEVVKLMREVLATVAPHVLLLTETNVPHEENVSYFGDGDEAHMVYQFSLPPLLLDAFLHYDATPLKNWLGHLQPPQPGTTYFNFTASHDGVGMRPLEGKVSDERRDSLVQQIEERGGRVSMRSHADGSESPYELNVTYFDALSDSAGDEQLHLRRFLSTQAMMLALQGMPAIYFHSLVGTPNDEEGATSSGINRRINRRKYRQDEINQLLQADTKQRRVFQGMQALIRTRTKQPAFHPDAQQRYIESGSASVVMLERHCTDTGQRILVVLNVGNAPAHLPLAGSYQESQDLISGERANVDVETGELLVEPAQIMWLERSNN